MDSNNEFKSFYTSYILIFIILLFVIVYVIINWEQVYAGYYFSGQIVKPILITGIIFLIVHMVLTWDDNVLDSDDNFNIPKYKLGSKFDINDKNIPDAQYVKTIQIPDIMGTQVLTQAPASVQAMSSNPKYRIVNKFDTNPIPNPIPNTGINMGINMGSNTGVNMIPNLNHMSLNQKPNEIQNIMRNLNNTNSIDSKLSNQNIFISQKNLNKYGLKF